MRVGSLFSGVGGFELGFDAAGCETAWQVEIDASARSVLARHWPNVARFTDVREVGAHCLAPVDVITFGSPCQDLSVAGKRAGLEGARSSLFHEAVRIIRELRPEWAVWENVPGAFSSNGGRDFGAVLDALADAGALDICWRVLDAQWFGIAQRRRRVFVVADFGGRRAAQVLLEPESSRGDSAPRRAPRQDVAYALAASARGTGDGHGDAWTTTYVAGVAHTLGAVRRGVGNAWNTTYVANALTASAGHHGHSSPRGDGSDNLVVSKALTSRQTRLDVSEETFVTAFHPTQSPVYGPISPALGHEAMAVARASGVRRLTPREHERLMGWPDDWTRYRPDGSELSDSARYRLTGNGVVAPVSAWIARKLMAAHISTVPSQDGAASSVSARNEKA